MVTGGNDYFYAHYGYNANATTESSRGNPTSYIRLAPDLSNQTPLFYSGQIYLYNPNDSTIRTNITYQFAGVGNNDTTNFRTTIGGGCNTWTNSLTGLNFNAQGSSTIANFQATVYGLTP